MKLQFKHQKFQADAAKAVCDVYAGQPYLTPTYMMDKGIDNDAQISMTFEQNFTGWGNQRLVPELNENIILENLNKVQRSNQIEPSKHLEGRYNLTIEMETGVGKTYTYIKTMSELNKRYGWSKFIVIVPSVAIREGVYKSFQITQDHFAEDYGKKIRFFIYNSAQLTEIDRFASDSSINVMIINSQAFNAKGKDTRRIYMKLDEFRSRRPIDIIAKTNPILIIDEPQSVEGKQTKERLKEFNPFITLRYSATHKKDNLYNMVYRLDAMEAYNKKLVKKIAVKGISVTGSTATEGYLYLELFQTSKQNISLHIKNVFSEGELNENSVVKEYLTTADDGKTVQNKMHWAAHGHTAAEIIALRADSEKQFMGLTHFAGNMPNKSEVTVAKNYLTKDEIDILNHIVSAYLEFAEMQAKRRKVMYIQDWIVKLDDFLRLSESEILTHKGRISSEDAEQKARLEYEKYKERTKNELSTVERDFCRL